MYSEFRGKRSRSQSMWVAAAMMIAGPSLAQTSVDAAKGAEAGGATALSEVIVTATRREESVLDVPISITALSTDNLVRSNIKNVADLATIVPGISFQPSTSLNPALSNVSIRGVTSASGDPTTGLYLDDVSISEQGNTNFGTPLPALFDLARVEVLRGPQGTLFGAGAMGGAIRFIQNQPGLQEFTGRATAEAGYVQNGGAVYEMGAAFGGPIVADKLGFRVSIWQQRSGGYIDRFDPIAGQVADNDANRTQTWAGRLAATWAPTDAIQITPSFYWQRLKSPNSGFYHMDISNPSEDEFRNGSLHATPIRDRFYIPSLTVQMDLGFADLTAVSSYLDRTASSVGDLTASFGARGFLFGFPTGFGNPLSVGFAETPADWNTQTNGISRHSFTQEVRLASSNRDARLAWTAGVYYDSSKQYVTDRWSGAPFDLFVYYGSDTRTEQKQLSGFAQFDLRVARGLTLTAGVRASRVEVDKSQELFPGPSFAEHSVSKPVNPKFGVEYRFDSGNLVYVSAGKGFRSGGVNLGLPQTQLCQEQTKSGFGPDSLWSYEIGTKNRLFEDRATFVASVFRINWSDIQTGIPLPQCGGAPVVNAGAAKVDGFDADLSVALNQQLRADLSFVYNDSKYTKSLFTGAGRAVVLDGYALSAALAPWSVTGALAYSFQLGGREAFIRAEDVYRARSSGPFMFDVPNSQSYNPDLGPNPGWNLLNLRAGVTVGNAQLALFVTNALNAHPTLGWDNRVSGGSFVYANTITPRTVGLNLNYEF